MTARVGIKYVALRTGMSRRTVQLRSKLGLIPSAAKPGGKWTYDPATIDRWVRRCEEEVAACRQETSTGAAKPGGRASRFEGGTYAEAYERLLSPRHASG